MKSLKRITLRFGVACAIVGASVFNLSLNLGSANADPLDIVSLGQAASASSSALENCILHSDFTCPRTTYSNCFCG